MAYEQRDNSGSVFKNKRKRNENDAAYTGDAKIDGKEYWINCWPKKDKNGDTWMSFSFREKKPRSQDDVPLKTQSKHDIELSDDIPF